MLTLISLIAPALAGPHTAMIGVESAEVTKTLAALVGSKGGALDACFTRARFCVATFPSAPPLDALRAHPGVRYAEQDRLMDGAPAGQAGPPSVGTTDCPDLWDMDAIGIEDAWALAADRGAASPVVAIQDGGFLLSHEDIAGQVSGQWDYGDGDPVPQVEWDVGVPAHGTFIAGIVAGRDDNDIGRVGVLPDGAMNLQKIADSTGAMYFSYAASAMADLADGDLGVRVLSYSIASSSYSESFHDAVQSLEDAGILLVVAAGNCSNDACPDADNDRYPLYPANFTDAHVVTVAGSLQDGGLNSWSHYGASSVDLAAPGVDICSLGVLSDTDSYTASGTSYATPIVAAIAALTWGRWPALTTTEMARLLRASAVEHPDLYGKIRSGGGVSAVGALTTAMPRMPAPSDVRFAGETTMALDLQNVAAEGSATVLMTHDPSLQIASADGDWTAAAFAIGDELTLPDAGRHIAESSGTMLTGPLPADSTVGLALRIRALAPGSSAATARLIATSPGADYLNAPYSGGSDDETGFLAWSFAIDATDAWDGAHDTGDTGDTGEPAPGDGGADTGPVDSGMTDWGKACPDGGDGTDECPGNACSCATGAAAPTPLLFALAGVFLIRRRRRGA